MTKLKSFKELSRDGTLSRVDGMRIRLEDIHEEPGFNLRDVNEIGEDGVTFQDKIEELAEFILGGGMVPPLEVRVRAEGGVWLVDGHRRRLAYLLLDSRGQLPRVQAKDDPERLEAWIHVRQFVGNDVDRIARIITSQKNEKLPDLAIAEGIKRLMALGLDVAQVCKMLVMKEHKVRALMVLANANNDVKTAVKQKVVKPTVAIETVRKHGENAGTLIAEAKAASATGKVTGAALKPRKLPKDLIDRAIKSLREFTGEHEPTEAEWDRARDVLAAIDKVLTEH